MTGLEEFLAGSSLTIHQVREAAVPPGWGSTTLLTLVWHCTSLSPQ